MTPDSDAKAAGRVRAAFARGAGTARTLLSTRRGKLIALATATVVALGGVTATALSASGDDGSRYRTATAEQGTVAETLSLTGQVSSSTSADAAFQVSGTVDEVLVELGDQVDAGDPLATLDTTDLASAVADARDALAQAKQQLEDDLTTQSSGSSTTSSSSGGSSSKSSGSSGSKSSRSKTDSADSDSDDSESAEDSDSSEDSDSTEDSDDSDESDSSEDSDDSDAAVEDASQDVADAQSALLAQYEAAVAAQEASSEAATLADELCAPFMNATVEDDESAGDDLADTQAALADCQAAIADAADKQQQTASEQAALNDKATALDSAVTALRQAVADALASTSTTTSSLPSSTGSGLTIVTASTVSTAQDDSGGSSGTSSQDATITSETILADRAQIDLAKAELAIAKQDLALATLNSPVSGTVVSVGIAPDDSVSAGSDTAVVTVQGSGGYIVEATVPLARIESVSVGQSADVALPALGSDYTATVASIGVLDVSSTATPAYTVTLALDADDDDVIRVGATADATVALASVDDVLTVPTSAVTVAGSQATVQVLTGGEVVATPVELGAIGTERTEIASGIEAGDTVVLADLTLPITSDSSSSTSSSLSDLGDSQRSGPQSGAGGGPPGR
ncbi:MAG: HlyD family efflux transporter periplasmic adaptor subunit [Microbacterium sp.]|uniref:HlyD family efflux transporter periplasmic adaptor subunit n=1 Tax=Microbacterium sp. TaxID=51671 RepID=UPI0039E4FC6B